VQAAPPRHRHLTRAMRDALRAARSQPLRRVHKPDVPGRPPWPAHPASLAALVRRELVIRGAEVSRKGFRMDVWTITDAGVEALEFVAVRRDIVRTLRVPGGSTRLMQLGVWVDVRMPEPEEMWAAA
jgi:hypothetical protein